MRLHLPILFALFAAPLGAQLDSPRPGFFHIPGQPVQSLYGIAGNLVPGPAPFGTASAISFSDKGGLVAQSGRIELVHLDGSVLAAFDSGESALLLNIDRDLSSVVAWLPRNHAALWWSGEAFVAAPVHDEAFGGAVTSIALDLSRTLHFLVNRPDNTVYTVTVSLRTGDLVSSDFLPGVRGPAFQFGQTILWTNEAGLHIDTSGFEHVLPFPAGCFAATRMSADWIHLSALSTGSEYALHLDRSEPTLSRIPGRPADRP